MSRRNFLKNSSVAAAGLISAPLIASCKTETETNTAASEKTNPIRPIAICTWNFENATAKAWEVLKVGGSSLDAVQQGAMIEEADVNNQTVGVGGRPDRDGNVTLDACIMDKDGNCGAVLAIQNIASPVSVARKVMEDTPHVMLAGKGAEKFAYEKGFEKVDLLTEKSKQEWIEWKKTSEYKPIINIENHDTIGILAIDKDGACTTSGMGYKYAGRVGDSPIIGAGLFVDNEIGAANRNGRRRRSSSYCR
ncbi:N(4)-(Beta-N-acetylglucosaminyl)-L-asparaginase [Nymphon striatum]|nr:N(4)-(Beta-N-acetylglucosaminyl)-L-asparaginase [Nymphon striatum]